MFYAFDLLHLDGWDLRACRLDARKAVLAAMPIWTDSLRYSDHVDRRRRPGAPAGLLPWGSRASSPSGSTPPTAPGRSADWVKLKCQGREEFVVVGWTPPAGSRTGVGALHHGLPTTRPGHCTMSARVGTGFDEKTLAALRKRLEPMKAPVPDDMLLTGENARMPRSPGSAPNWSRRSQFTGWSGAGRVRHAVYLGLREDKSAAEIVRDVPDPECPRAPLRKPRAASVVTARPPDKRTGRRSASRPPATPPVDGGAVRLTHPGARNYGRASPSSMLADYWAAVCRGGPARHRATARWPWCAARTESMASTSSRSTP